MKYVICMCNQVGVKVFHYVRVVLGFLWLCVQHVSGDVVPPAEGEEQEEDDEGPRLAAAPEEPG